MLQLKNNTPFQSSIFVFPNEQGIDTLYVVVKATFAVGDCIEVAETQRPVAEAKGLAFVAQQIQCEVCFRGASQQTRDGCGARGRSLRAGWPTGDAVGRIGGCGREEENGSCFR